MPEPRCVHGLDRRFCAVCNKVSAFGQPRAALGGVDLAAILGFLNDEQARATYGAVGEALGVSGRTLAGRLGDRAGEHGEPGVIASGIELVMRMTAWKNEQRN